MNLFEWLQSRWSNEAVHYTYLWIRDANVQLAGGAPFVPVTVQAGQHYYRLWLAEMFLKNDRDWGSSWYPAVMSSVELKFGNSTQQISHVAGETSLRNLDMTKLDKGVAVNHEVTTLLPFNGGTVRLEAAMLGMQGKSDLKSLLRVLGDFSKLLVVPQLSSALAVAEPLANGIAELVGATNAHPVLRLEDAWGGDGSGTANPLHSGYFTVISAQVGELDPDELFVRNNQLYRGSTPMTGYHYMLFRVDVTQTRDDWDSLTSISDPYQQAIDLLESALKSDDEEVRRKLRNEAEKRFSSARVAAFRAPELTSVVGKNQVLDALDRRWKEAKQQLGAGAVEGGLVFPRTLRAVMHNPLSVTDALERGELTEEDLLAHDQ